MTRIRHIQLCLWALAVLLNYRSIAFGDRYRLWRKTLRLYACFLAFTDRDRPYVQLRGAMISALLSSLYDYETDWVPVGRLNDSIFLKFLKGYVDDNQTRLVAHELFWSDRYELLSVHGLERGSVALAVYVSIIKSEWLSHYSKEEIAEFGRLLQIIDDLLDVELDRKHGDTNCLFTEEAAAYRKEAQDFLESEFFRTLVSNAGVYAKIRLRCLCVLGIN